MFDIISVSFNVLLMEGDELLFYYTTPQAKKQAENAGNAKENTIFPADFLPGACRTGVEERKRLFHGFV